MANKPATTDSTDSETEQSVEEIVEQLETRCDILTDTQAEAWAHRDGLGHSRAETADAVGRSMSAVDNRLGGARRNLIAAADLVRRAHALGAYHTAEGQETLDQLRAEIGSIETEDDSESIDDEILGRLDQLTETVEELSAQQERRQTAADAPEQNATKPTAEDSDGSARLWGRLIDHCSGSSLTRSDGAVAVTVDDDLVEDAQEILNDLGYAIWTTGDAGDGKTKIRGRGSTPDQEDADDRLQEESDEQLQETDDDAQPEGGQDVRDLDGVGAKKAEDLRSRGYQTVKDVATTHATNLMNKPIVGGKIAAQIRHEARKRLGLGQHSDEDAEDRLQESDDDRDLDDSDEDALRCEGCGQVFETGPALGSHKATCGEIDAEAVCDDCGATFDSAAALGGHRSSCSAREETEHVCRGCGATFASGAALGGHRVSCDEVEE